MKEEISALRTKCTAYFVISSSGEAAKIHGGVIGQFEFNWEKGCYVQASTEQSNEKFRYRYLYQDDNNKWWVSDTLGEKRGWLRSNPSKTLPTSGWQYADQNKNPWQEDLTLTVTPGPLPPLPRQFTVTATGAAAVKWPSYLGVFTRTQRWWNGMPVYVNTEGRLLHHGNNDSGWMIGDKLGYKALRGSWARHSPASEDNWRYWTGSEHKPAFVTVTGSD